MKAVKAFSKSFEVTQTSMNLIAKWYLVSKAGLSPSKKIAFICFSEKP